MPKCELCGEVVGRRTKYLISKQIKLLCNYCCYYLSNGDHLKAIVDLGEHRIDYKKMRREINRLSLIVSDKNVKISKDYPYSNPWSAVPPVYVLRNARKALDIQKKFSGFPETLGDYYGILAPPYSLSPSMVPEGAIACYYPATNHVYSKGSMSEHTAFHEMYHALERHGIVPKTADSEKNADFYADACCDLLNKK